MSNPSSQNIGMVDVNNEYSKVPDFMSGSSNAADGVRVA